MEKSLVKLLTISELLREELSKDVPMSQISVLLLVAVHDGITQAEIQKKLNMLQGSLSRNVRQLAEYYGEDRQNLKGYGLIEARPDLYDRKRNFLSLTTRGKILMNKIMEVLNA